MRDTCFMSRVSRIFLLQTLYQEAFKDIPLITLTEPYAFVFPDEAAVFHGLNGSYVVRKADVIVATQAWLRHDGRQWLEEIGTVFTEMLRKAEVLRFLGKWTSRYFYFRYEFCLYINGSHSAGQRQRRDCCCI